MQEHPKTAQEIFDRVASHLFEQGEPAFDVHLQICLYHSSTGSKCAVGCLISDADYHSWMDDSLGSVDVLVMQGYEPVEWMKEFLPLLIALQQLHDSGVGYVERDSNWATTYTMREGLSKIAQEYGLNFIPENYSFKDR